MQISRKGPAERIERLRSIPMLARCSKRELRSVDALTCELTVSAGRCLASEGSFTFGLGVIIDGGARISLRGVPLFEIGNGSCYGATAMLDGGPQVATVVATRRTSVLVAGPREFRDLIRVPAVAAGLLQWYTSCSRLGTSLVAQGDVSRSASGCTFECVLSDAHSHPRALAVDERGRVHANSRAHERSRLPTNPSGALDTGAVSALVTTDALRGLPAVQWLGRAG